MAGLLLLQFHQLLIHLTASTWNQTRQKIGTNHPRVPLRSHQISTGPPPPPPSSRGSGGQRNKQLLLLLHPKTTNEPQTPDNNNTTTKPRIGKPTSSNSIYSSASSVLKRNSGNLSISELRLCFDEMIRMNPFPPVSSFEPLIVVLAKNKHYYDVFKLYSWINSNGLFPSFIMINVLLNGFCNLNWVSDGFVALGSMIRRVYQASPDPIWFGQLPVVEVIVISGSGVVLSRRTLVAADLDTNTDTTGMYGSGKERKLLEMAPTTIRKAIGAVKDQTSIGIAKVASNMAPELEVAIVKATSHDDDPASEKYIREILNLTSYSRGYVHACVTAISKRLGKTRDWIVALKALMLIHRLLNEGDPLFQEEILFATRRGTRLLNLSDFRDEAHSSSWDHSAFVRTYAMVLTPLREMKPEKIFVKMGHMQRLFDRFLACRPTGLAKINRMILIALYPVVRESFQLYADVCEVLAVLLDKFFDMEYPDCVKTFDAYASAAKQIDELVGFYNWCKETGVARSSEYPEVQRITGKLLETLEEFVRDRSKRPKSPEKREELPAPPVQEEEPVPDMNEIKALPAPESYTPPPPPEPEPKPQQQEVIHDLVDLREESVTADDQGNKFALALFAGPGENKANGSWEPFSSNGQPQVTSAWQTPAADPTKADWELALVESASNLSLQKQDLGGGLDPLLLNGMYDQGVVRQHVSTAHMSGGSASSVALPGLGKTNTPVLALPAPDGSGTVHAVNQDPFAASLTIPPPSYVQMSDMEKKQSLLVQEQQVWNQYAREGMQGQTSLAKLSGNGYMAPNPYPVMQYGMPQPQVNGMGPPAGYYYNPY
uniref:ENTH domain-containing protein n=1 Tax=Cannabis sativa TaxID=3483 RepID=A0A803NKL6_CANSA